ncbi:hypothetical protein, partial [Peribacillus frigoritolerans]|uniref:hypothetical protein n=1 Tax=Peribacillus frigoritolerans TaxID=450367 RepID=UPI0020C12F1E
GVSGTMCPLSLPGLYSMRNRSIINDMEETISEPISDNSLLYEITEFSEWIMMKDVTAYRKQKNITLKARSSI